MLKEAKTTEHPLMATYNRLPIEIKSGKGSYVWDSDGERYLDYTAGIATCNLGHLPDAVKKKIEGQLEQIWHCSNLYKISTQELLANKLVQLSCTDQVFFCNSGAEANEAAIKLARKYTRDIKQREGKIVTFTQSFHGRTLATLSATGQEKIQQGFDPLLSGFHHLPYNDSDGLKDLSNETTSAVLLELVQGEGGVIPANPEWVKQLAQICEDEDILLMVDEIQTGIGRTGTFFAYEQYGIEPDVITLAKGLGSGFPIGALLAKKEISAAFSPGSHGSTFGGNPLATAAGLATIETIQHQNVLTTAQENSAYLKQQLEKLQAAYPEQITEVRGKGSLIGLETKPKAIELVHKARELSVLILTAGEHVIRILPPLTTNRAEIDEFISVMKDVFYNA